MALTRPRASQIFNLDYKQATRVVTTTNVTLAGGAPAVVDGVTLVTNDRVLVTGQTTGSQNGLYFVTTAGTGSNGTWARTSDGDTNGEIEAGMIIMVTEGSIYADTQWKLITDNPITIGVTALVFTQNYLANSISSGNSNVVVNNNGTVNLSSAGTPNVLVVGSNTITTSANIIPSANAVYSLGNATNNWAELYLSGNSLYIGGGTLSTQGANLLFNGNVIATVNGTSIDRGAAPTNWDSLVNMGTYSVDYASWSGTTGTPVDSSVYVGILSVLTSGVTTTQSFYPGTVTANNVKIQWDRTLYNGTWTAWYKIINDFQVVDAGTY
jgi:hypothetical protein